jgi:DNA-binding transcriptional regulator/RsmH inhibitor MraZ
VFPPPTFRLSPKNQVTLPRDARSLAGLGEDSVVCGRPGQALHADPAKQVPILSLMTVEEVARREEALRAEFGRDQNTLFRLLTTFNAGIKQMAVDGQRRIVLPGAFVEYLGVERDVLFICTNSTVQVWNPQHFLAWSAGPDEQTRTTLDRFAV